MQMKSFRTFCTNSPERVDIMFVDKLFLQHHLHGNNDLSQDDQKVSCRTEERSVNKLKRRTH